MGDADVPEQSLIAGAKAARGHEHDFGGALDAIVAIDHHWEEDYQCRHQDFWRHAVTEPEHQQRRQGEYGHGLRHQQYGQGSSADQAPVRHGQRQYPAATKPEQQAQGELGDGDE